MPKSETNEAVAIAAALRPTVDEWERESSRSCVRMKKMTVATPYDGSTHTIGVREAFASDVQNVPCVPCMRGALVGSPVWVQWLYGDKSTMCVVRPGDISEYIDGAVNPNLVDNWYFIGGGSQQNGGQFPINQRRQTVYNGDSYTIDRWRVDSGVTATIYSTYVRFANTKSEEDNYVRQRMLLTDNPPFNKTITGTILYADGTMDTGSFYVDLTVQTDNYKHIKFFEKDWGFFSYELPPTGSNFYEWHITLHPSSHVDIAAIKVEYGTASTLCYYDYTDGLYKVREVPNFHEQMQRCLSYCVVLNSTGTAYARYGIGVAYSSTQARIIVPFPTRMICAPSSFSMNGNIWMEAGANGVAVSSASIDNVTADNATLTVVSSGLTSYRAYYVYDHASGDSRMIFSVNI